MISVEEARRRLLALVDVLPPEQVALPEGLGRVLAEDLLARRTQPPFPASAMDGYAVRAADVAQVPARLLVVGSVPAGRAYAGTVASGEAVRIFTGAPVPAGADCIVIQEDTERDGDTVIVREGAPTGRYVLVNVPVTPSNEVILTEHPSFPIDIVGPAFVPKAGVVSVIDIRPPKT